MVFVNILSDFLDDITIEFDNDVNFDYIKMDILDNIELYDENNKLIDNNLINILVNNSGIKINIDELKESIVENYIYNESVEITLLYGSNDYTEQFGNIELNDEEGEELLPETIIENDPHIKIYNNNLLFKVFTEWKQNIETIRYIKESVIEDEDDGDGVVDREPPVSSGSWGGFFSTNFFSRALDTSAVAAVAAPQACVIGGAAVGAVGTIAPREAPRKARKKRSSNAMCCSARPMARQAKNKSIYPTPGRPARPRLVRVNAVKVRPPAPPRPLAPYQTSIYPTITKGGWKNRKN